MVLQFVDQADRVGFAWNLAQPWIASSGAARVMTSLSPPPLEVDSGKLRRWAREGRLDMLGIEYRDIGGQYWVSTADLVAYGHRRLEELQAAIDELEELRAEGLEEGRPAGAEGDAGGPEPLGD